jgi:hypothetical protein
MKHKIKFSGDCLYLIVNDKAKAIFDSNIFTMYVLVDSDNEIPVRSYQDIEMAESFGLKIGIEVDMLNDILEDDVIRNIFLTRIKIYWDGK